MASDLQRRETQTFASDPRRMRHSAASFHTEVLMSQVERLPLVEALWWFIENHATVPPDVEQESFMLLRDRYRREHQAGAAAVSAAPANNHGMGHR